MRIAVVYWSSTGNTEAMASLIGEGIRQAGAYVEVLPVVRCEPDMPDRFDRLAFGCPASADEELDDMEFLPFYSRMESSLRGREVALFGSYGWGDGKWMRDWETRMRSVGARLFERGLAVREDPSGNEQVCRDFGFRFARFTSSD